MTNLVQHITKCARQLGKTQYTNQALLDIYAMYLGDGGKPFVDSYGRKGWESQKAHDLKDARAYNAPASVPDVSSLPEKRWVKARPLEGSAEEQEQMFIDRKTWLEEHKAKHQICRVMLHGKEENVVLFKKQRDALMFKLAWG